MRKVLYILGHLSDEDVEWMAQAGERVAMDDGAVLIEQGQARVDRIYIVLDGTLGVAVEKLGEIATLGVGEVVGEMSFLDSAPPSATVRAKGSCLLLALEKRDLEARIQAQPAFGGRFYKALAIFLADRLRGTVRHFGYGETGSLEGDAVMEDELDENVLDAVSLAGTRFDLMMKTLRGARER
jgi:CRP-like cAMP-binding protein